MKAVFHLSPLVSVEAEGADHKTLFTELAGLAEVFSIDTCGKCKSHEIAPIVRDVDGVKFYEYRCRACGSRMSMGQSKEGGVLYPRKTYHKQHPDVKAKKAKVGDYLPDGGWTKYVKPSEDEGDS